jgi:protein TonB
MKTKKNKKVNLENKKILFREIGLALTLAFVLAAFEWGVSEKSTKIFTDSRNIIDDPDIIITTSEPPTLPPVVPKPPMLTDEFEIVDNEINLPEVVILPPDSHLPIDITAYVPPVEAPEEDPDIPFTIVEKKPKFMGGDENEFTKWVFSKLVYPEAAKGNGVGGRVTVEFVVTATGAVTSVKVLRGVDPALDKEVVRVISSSLKWEPGEQHGKPVRVKYIFPVTFRIQ